MLDADTFGASSLTNHHSVRLIQARHVCSASVSLYNVHDPDDLQIHEMSYIYCWNEMPNDYIPPKLYLVNFKLYQLINWVTQWLHEYKIA